MDSKSSINLLSIAILLSLCHWANTELFTAMAEVEPLLETHKRIIDELNFYIEKEESRFKVLKKHLNQYKKEHEKAMEDIPNYLGNPINAFTLIKRLTTDLDLIEESIKKGTNNSNDYIKNITMNHSDVKYPTLEDLTGAAQALTRLQETYLLNVHELSEGVLNGIVYSFHNLREDGHTHTPMTTAECYELGKALYNERDFKNALAWMAVALHKYRDANDESYSFTDVDILEYIGFAHYLLGDVKTALKWTNKLLAIDPDHVRALGNVTHFIKSIKEKGETLKKKRRRDTGDDKQNLVEGEEPDLGDGNFECSCKNERTVYEALCRGEMEIPAEISKRLRCWYSTENHPFLKYAPIKTEQLYIKPDVLLFHEVMSDSEIELIKSLAAPRFQRALVHDPKTFEAIATNYRISKSSWLKDEESPEIARISQRVTDMTGLSMISAEELQVVNYGIGGHYIPHFDFALKREIAIKSEGWVGNRIATVLFYMSDVAQGGATVFTELGLSLFPVKRTAAFWMNLHPSGEGDMATRHAGCPVLRGSKWVSNKWIHFGGQEFLKPCNLEYQAEGIALELLKPVKRTSR